MKITRNTRPTDEATLKACINSPWWRINNLYHIQNKESDRVRFRANWAQTEFYRSMHTRNCVLKVRQLGISTFAAIWGLDRMLWNDNQTLGLVDKTREDAAKKLDKLAFAWKWMDDMKDDPLLGEIGRMKKADLGIERRGEHLPEKSNESVIQLSNGSEMWAGVSLRGGTCHVLHVSELGIIAHSDPSKGEEIRKGAFPTVGKTGIIINESTHEGGKIGVNYDIIKSSMANRHKKDSEYGPLDWKLFFFSWMKQDEYRLPAGSVVITPMLKEYFASLRDRGIILDEEQMAWYAATYETQQSNMKTEYPTMIEEALTVQAGGSIYGDQITNLRGRGGVKTFTHEREFPIWSFWDLGMDDGTVIWLVQFVGREVLWLKCYESRGHPFHHYWQVIQMWERELGQVVDGFFVPHDANVREKGSGETYVDTMRKAGVPNHQIHVVPKSPDIWRGINALRLILEKSVFHTDTDQPRRMALKDEFPSALECLELYRSQVEPDKTIIKSAPVHDYTSHTADAARMVAEAKEAGLIERARHMAGNQYAQVTGSGVRIQRGGGGGWTNVKSSQRARK